VLVENSTFYACIDAVVERLQMVEMLTGSNSPAAHRAGLVSGSHAISALARRFLEAPEWPGHEVPDEIIKQWKLQWYQNYCIASLEIDLAMQQAVREGRLIPRSTSSRVPLPLSSLGSWLERDLTAAMDAAWKEFFPAAQSFEPLSPHWPDVIVNVPAAFYLSELAYWTNSEGITKENELEPLIREPRAKSRSSLPTTEADDVPPYQPFPEGAQPVKRKALIANNLHHWETVEQDLKSASENGLSAVAKLPSSGWWSEIAALEWARQRGKLKGDTGTMVSLPWTTSYRHKISS
jgi:hypothetical protein